MNGKRRLGGAFGRIVLRSEAKDLADVSTYDAEGRLLGVLDEPTRRPAYLPAPGDNPRFWVMPDAPRIIPPSWAGPPPPDPTLPNSGWDISNDSVDVYVFLPGDRGADRIRKDFLRLTGPIPMLPMYALGFIDSKYHPYSDTEALGVIDTYRGKQLPLDMFVADTDWRVGASHGYEINTELFPDMREFLRKCHERHVKVMFNDHPEPVTD